MRLNILLVLCCVILTTSAVKSVERPGDTNVSIETRSRVKRQDPFTVAGVVISVISTIVSLVTSTVGLTQPSATDLRLDTVIAQLNKIESHLANLDTTLLDVFDVQQVKDMRNKIELMEDARDVYLQFPNAPPAIDDYVSLCKTNRPQDIVKSLYNAQCGQKLFGGKKLSDYCIMYRSKDLYQYGVSPYQTAQQLVLIAQEAMLNAVICMNATKITDVSYFNFTVNLMFKNIKKLNQSLDDALLREETRVKYAIKGGSWQNCVGARKDTVQTWHFTSYTDCQSLVFGDEQLWQFDLLEFVGPDLVTKPNAPRHFTLPAHCNDYNELKTPNSFYRAFDVHDIPQFATGYTKFDNNTVFQMRNFLRNEVVYALTIEMKNADTDGTPPFDHTGFVCLRICSLLKWRGNTYIPNSFLSIRRNPSNGMGTTTFTIASSFDPTFVLTWKGGKCNCAYFDSIKAVDTDYRWSIFGIDKFKTTPLV